MFLGQYFLNNFREESVNPDDFVKRSSVELMKVSKISGSRNSDGNVPKVYWNDASKLNVNWYNPDNANDNLRSREVVSNKSPD